MSLYYPPLNKKSTVAVWTKYLERTMQQKPNLKIKEDEIINWAKNNYKILKWNGRQIRNAFQTAIALAEFAVKERDGAGDESHGPRKPRKAKLTTVQFDSVSRASQEFDRYIEELYGARDEELAKRWQNRTDDFIRPQDSFEASRRRAPDSRKRPKQERYVEPEEASSSFEERNNQHLGGDQSTSEDSEQEVQPKSRVKRK